METFSQLFQVPQLLLWVNSDMLQSVDESMVRIILCMSFGYFEFFNTTTNERWTNTWSTICGPQNKNKWPLEYSTEWGSKNVWNLKNKKKETEKWCHLKSLNWIFMSINLMNFFLYFPHRLLALKFNWFKTPHIQFISLEKA